ncbi:MAG TPA: TAXI family TRAP transporter solute-binding subunit, partial [Candidatus Binatia bacterium]
LVGHKALPEAAVMTMLKGIWENIAKLPPLHPGFAEWTRERAVDPEVTLPYHPAAVQFYKEQKSWPAKMDEIQKKLLALNP